ncbi:peptidase M23 [Prevotella herbatica]|uniref:Peptidase M23 n=1 Tax=Prevotella herbatica TaxID=2801997 RepID=A0ABM7NYG7_9BACT|nr:peptidoglycan DD-metalloendopeptidase family protein [Prevotella herbatica]BCS85548.1 peptidase M23 [Prevotella herbatica]
MNLKKNISKFYIVALFALTAIPSHGQDLLARQAPIDRKLKAVDTLALKSIIEREKVQSPAADLYNDWDNRYAHHRTEMPDSFKIDLRHFCMPTPSRVVTSNFGSRWGRPHKGLDIKVYIGDSIRAAFSGKVRIVRYEAAGYGKYIVIRHPNGLETIYGHLSEQLVSENQTVRAGEVIGLGGNTGRSTGSHLHFETRLCGVALNPALMFDFRNQDVTGDYFVYNSNTYDRESADATRIRGKIGNGGYTRDLVQDGEPGRYSGHIKENSAEILYHKVKAGETIQSISKKRGVSIDKICQLNHLSSKSHVRPGQILRYS